MNGGQTLCTWCTKNYMQYLVIWLIVKGNVGLFVGFMPSGTQPFKNMGVDIHRKELKWNMRFPKQGAQGEPPVNLQSSPQHPTCREVLSFSQSLHSIWHRYLLGLETTSSDWRFFNFHPSFC